MGEAYAMVAMGLMGVGAKFLVMIYPSRWMDNTLAHKVPMYQYSTETGCNS